MTAISELSDLAANFGAKTLSARIQAELVQKLLDDKFYLVALGEFNHGKSSFVNALLGSKVLPVGITPTTAVIHHIEYADEPRARAILADGASRPLTLEEIAGFAVSKESRSDELAHIELFYPAEVLRDIVLVDTPGVNDLSLQRADITYGYIPRADAVLFLLDAGQVLKESERAFLESKLMGKARDKIIFIVNKADIYSPEEREEARQYLEEHLGKLVDSPVIFFISAERARDEAASGLPELIDYLMSFLAEERGRILLDNALGDAILATEALDKGLIAKRRGLEMPVEELSRRIRHIEKELEGAFLTIEDRRGKLREEVAAIKAWARRDLEHFRDDTIRRLPEMIDSRSGEEVKRYLGPFLEESFRGWASREAAEIAEALEKLAEETIALVREDARALARKVAQGLGKDVRAPAIEVDTFVYDVGVSALFTMGVFVMFGNLLLGGLLALAAPVLAVYLRERVEGEIKARAKELAPKALHEAVEKVAPKLDAMIDDFASRLDAWILNAGEELHRQVLEMLSAAQEARKSASTSSVEALAACEREAEALHLLRSRLVSMREAFAEPR